MKRFFIYAFAIATLGFIISCTGNTEAVDSGVYKGVIKEVNADESEIYVESEGRTLELYFTDETTLTRNGENVSFDVLEENQSVKVEVEKVGQRLDPLSVEIIE